MFVLILNHARYPANPRLIPRARAQASHGNIIVLSLLKLFRVPNFITNQGEEQEKLTTRRRNERISTVSQEATNKKLESARECQRVPESERVCSKHFALKLSEESGFSR